MRHIILGFVLMAAGCPFAWSEDAKPAHLVKAEADFLAANDAFTKALLEYAKTLDLKEMPELNVGPDPRRSDMEKLQERADFNAQLGAMRTAIFRLEDKEKTEEERKQAQSTLRAHLLGKGVGLKFRAWYIANKGPLPGAAKPDQAAAEPEKKKAKMRFVKPDGTVVEE